MRPSALLVAALRVPSRTPAAAQSYLTKPQVIGGNTGPAAQLRLPERRGGRRARLLPRRRAAPLHDVPAREEHRDHRVRLRQVQRRHQRREERVLHRQAEEQHRAAVPGGAARGDRVRSRPSKSLRTLQDFWLRRWPRSSGRLARPTRTTRCAPGSCTPSSRSGRRDPRAGHRDARECGHETGRPPGRRESEKGQPLTNLPKASATRRRTPLHAGGGERGRRGAAPLGRPGGRGGAARRGSRRPLDASEATTRARARRRRARRDLRRRRRAGARLPGFAFRAQQLAMAQAIARGDRHARAGSSRKPAPAPARRSPIWCPRFSTAARSSSRPGRRRSRTSSSSATCRSCAMR